MLRRHSAVRLFKNNTEEYTEKYTVVIEEVNIDQSRTAKQLHPEGCSNSQRVTTEETQIKPFMISSSRSANSVVVQRRCGLY